MSIIQPKIDGRHVLVTIQRAADEYPNCEPVVLHDDYVNLEYLDIPKINCVSASLAEIDKFDPQKTIFIYACDADEVGLPFVQKVVANGAKFLPPSIATPSVYAHINETARQVIELEYAEQQKDGYCKWDYGDFINIIQAIDLTRDLPGAFIEMGCFQGSSGGFAVRYMHALGMKRECYFTDVFDGFVYDEAIKSPDVFWANSHATDGQGVVTARLKRFANPAAGLNVHVQRANVITDELPCDKICLANVDVDLYEAVKIGLYKVADKIVQHGIIIVEDPGHTPQLIGARAALHEFLEDRGAEFISIYMESGQTFLIRK